MKKLLFIAMFFSGILILGSGFKVAELGEWPVPDKYKKMANPVKADAASIAEGKALWVKHCQSCHGKTGLGDGSKAAQLKSEPGDFSKASVHAQSDGSLFYKVLEGRDDMPSFKKKIPDQNELWSVVNYMRKFKK